MGTRFRPYNPKQAFLLPPSLQDWLPEGHLAYFISDTADQLDLSRFYAPYGGDGRGNSPFNPHMMVKILIYSYATGRFSSRKIARALQEDVPSRVLAAGNSPSHRAICDFRLRHLKEFHEVFLQVVRIAAEAGLTNVGRIAVDGSKVRANASKRKAMSYGVMKQQEKRLRQEIEQLTERARRRDAEEDQRLGADQTGEDIPEELHRREVRLKKIRQAKHRLEARQGEADRKRGRKPGDGRKSPSGKGRRFKREFGVPEDKAQDNFTDPESRIMKASGSFEQCFNTQLAVEGKSQIIVGASVGNNAADNDQLIPMVDAVQESLGRHPDQVLADAGFKSEGNFVELEKRRIDGHVSLGREGGKVAEPGPDYPATTRMHEKLQTEQGRSVYRRRKAIVEPAFGWIKENLGFRRFSLRGMHKAAGEWGLVCLAVNLKRMHGLLAAA